MTRHSSHSLGRLVFAAAALAAVLAVPRPAAAQAQAIIRVNDDVWFRLGMQLNGWADWTQTAPTRGYAENLFLRRARFLVTGSVAPGVTFYLQTDDPNLGKAPKNLATGFIIQDAWMEWKIADAFALDAGQFIVPFSRNSLQGTLSYLTMDISPTSTIIINANPADAARDTGVEAKGYLVDGGRLEYRFALTQGVRESGSRNAFRDTAYLQYDFFDTERGYVYHGTNLGKKKILALSAGYDGQNSYHAYNADVFTTIPVRTGDEIAGQVQWSHYDGESFLAAPARQNDYLCSSSAGRRNRTRSTGCPASWTRCASFAMPPTTSRTGTSTTAPCASPDSTIPPARTPGRWMASRWSPSTSAATPSRIPIPCPGTTSAIPSTSFPPSPA
jgi:hypothetical protein